MFGIIPIQSNKLNKFEESFNDFVSNFFRDDFFDNVNMGGDFKADIKETSNGYVVEAELPGVNKNDIRVDYKDNNLIITAFRNEILENNENNYIKQERHYGEFSRSFYVGNIDKNSIKAKFENGVLDVFLPKNQNYINNDTGIFIE